MSNKRKATRPEQRTYELKVIAAPVFSWASQHPQYPDPGEPGIQYFAGPTEFGVVDCLLYYDGDGMLRGILNHYNFDDTDALEQSGNINIFVDPTCKRQGIGTKLLDEAKRRYGFNVEQQTYTLEGVHFITKWLSRQD